MKDYLKEKYGAYELIRMAGGFTNATYLLKGDPELVVKVANLSNRDIDNERHVLAFLKAKDFTPQIVDTFMDDGTQIILSTFARGMNGQAVLDTGDVERAELLFTEMGLCLARNIHSMAFTGEPNGLRLGKTEPLRFDMSFMPASLRSESEAFVADFDTRQEEWVLTHGDYGAHNILMADPLKLTVIDWEWAEWFHPLVDLAWACWNTRLHYSSLADRVLPAFLEAYRTVNPIPFTPDDLKAFVLYKLHTIMTRMENAGEEAQKKWIHRLEWTLSHAII